MKDTFKYYKGSVSQLLLVSLSAIIISAISANNASSNFPWSILYFVIIGLFFLILFFITVGVLSIVNSSVKTKYGKGFVYGAVVHGFMLLFPFAVLLLISDVLLKWNAFQTIAATSIITSVSYSATDLIKLGGNRLANMILSLFIGIVFMLLFILIVSLKLLN